MLMKRKKFEWRDEHTNAIRRLKKLLLEVLALRKAEYTEGKPIYVTVDTSPTRNEKIVHATPSGLEQKSLANDIEDTPKSSRNFGLSCLR